MMNTIDTEKTLVGSPSFRLRAGIRGRKDDDQGMVGAQSLHSFRIMMHYEPCDCVMLGDCISVEFRDPCPFTDSAEANGKKGERKGHVMVGSRQMQPQSRQ